MPQSPYATPSGQRCDRIAYAAFGEPPSGPGVLDNRLIAEIAAAAPPPVATFLLTSEAEPSAIVEHARICGVNTVQLVDRVAPAAYSALRAGLPGMRLVQVIHVEGQDQIDEARTMGELADALLLDSGRPFAAIRELGGTGRTHDWSLSRKIVEASSCPVFLAGGLNSGNVARAIREVRPFGVDLCSGVRTDEKLDSRKLEAFMAEASTAPQP
jgi:phosphoribosylanthranilate isomerase